MYVNRLEHSLNIYPVKFFWVTRYLCCIKLNIFTCTDMLMCPGINHFINVLFLIRSQNEEWLDHISVYKTFDKKFKGKQKKIKTWPIYREHAGMWSRLNFSPTMCGCVWCPCVWCLYDELSFLFVLHFIHLYFTYSVSSSALNLQHITYT